jgi:hypothetical protein
MIYLCTNLPPLVVQMVYHGHINGRPVMSICIDASTVLMFIILVHSNNSNTAQQHLITNKLSKAGEYISLTVKQYFGTWNDNINNGYMKEYL